MDAIGTLYLDRNTGDVYRLRSYRTDWKAVPFTGEKTIPDYIHYADGGNSMVEELPTGLVTVYRPRQP